jgi:two-component SAPR family response regulator
LAQLEGEYGLLSQRPDLAVGHLERAAQSFAELHADRRAARSNLWLAEAHLLGQNPQSADAALMQALTVWRAIGADAILGELHSLPVVIKYLNGNPEHPAHSIHEAYRTQTQAANTESATRVYLHSLGGARLELAGQMVRLELRRSLEVLAYLMRAAQHHPEGSSIQDVLRDLFPDVPQRQARLYFHQVRYELEKKIPGLSVPYNAATRTYAIQAAFEITWDVFEFEAALAEQSPAGVTRAFKIYAGNLMPQAEGQWLESERAVLEAHALKSGLHWCKTWFERQQYGRCIQLATRLLEIDPFDESLAEHLVQATKALEGRVAARQTVKRLHQRFASELGGEQVTRPARLEPVP